MDIRGDGGRGDGRVGEPGDGCPPPLMDVALGGSQKRAYDALHRVLGS